MANAVYPKYLEALVLQSPSVDWDADTIKGALVTSAYTYSAAHQFFSSIAGQIGSSSPALTSKTGALGVVDAADVTFPTVAAGSTINALIIYKDTGTASTSPLIVYIDSTSDGSLPKATTGDDVVITWDNGASKIFTI